MASVATGNVVHRPHLVLLLQSVPERFLIGVRRALHNNGLARGRLLVTHVEDLFARAQIFFRGAVAVQAELHLQRRVLVHQRHLVDRTVAGVAAHTFADVDAVIEIYVVGQLVYARPFERAASAEAFADGLQISRVRPDLRVAVDAGLGGRDAGETRLLNRSVTVAAVDAKAGHVVLVAKGDGLRLPDSGIGDVWRPLHLHHGPKQPGHGKNREDH